MAWGAAANLTRTHKLRTLIRARTGRGVDEDVDQYVDVDVGVDVDQDLD